MEGWREGRDGNTKRKGGGGVEEDGGGGSGGGGRCSAFLTELASVTSFSPKEMWHKN